MTKDFLLHHHMSLDTLDHNAAEIFAGISGASSGIFEDVICYSGVVRNLFIHTVLTYLREKGILYRFPRRGRRSVLGESQVLPRKGDVVDFLLTRTETRLALITDILEAEIIQLRGIMGEGTVLFKKHCSQVCLAYRPSNPGTFLGKVVTIMRD